MSRKLAVFDIDGTLFKASLLEELIEGLIQREIFPPQVREDYYRQQDNWLTAQDNYLAYQDSLLSAFRRHIKGLHFQEFDAVAQAVVERNRNRVYNYARNLISRLSKNDYFLLAISSSPKGVLDKFCEGFGFDKVYGSFYELGPSDRFTGEIADEHIISNKGKTVRRAVQTEGLSFESSFGIGDSEDDIPFLELVENPICFNPTKDLYRRAKMNHWQVVVEQKGVVYQMPI